MRFLGAFLLLLVSAAWLPAQDFRATLNGTVADFSGPVVPNARVEVRNIETREARRAVTQANGQFSVPLLPPGTYTASAEAPGFKKLLRENIILRAGHRKRQCSTHLPMRSNGGKL